MTSGKPDTPVRQVLVIRYSQTGQLTDITQSVLSPLLADKNIELTWLDLQPDPPFPFPWNAVEFFDAMPESVKGIPRKLKPLGVDTCKKFDLILLPYQVWYLSPSIPFASFLQSEEGKKLLHNTPVVTLIGCRNMWIMAQEKVKRLLKTAGATLVGNIVLVDKAPNLVSVLTVIGWLIYGKRENFMGFLPRSGVSEADIRAASRFGEILHKRLKNSDWTGLQSELLAAGSAEINPSLLFLEKRGSKAFKVWASFIGAKGGPRDPNRRFRVRLLLFALPTAVFILSPITAVLSKLVPLLNKEKFKKEIAYYSETALRD